jgi:2,3-dihydroxybenzoate decarboxylase/5-carboxyvanillate decarboxylase
MNFNRRQAMGALSALAAAAGAAVGEDAKAQETRGRRTAKKVRKIATEEACSIPEVAAALKNVVRSTWDNLDTRLVSGVYNARPDEPSPILPQLLDIDSGRLAVMDQNGVDMHLLSLTAPGVQMFDADTATELATLANDRIAEAVRRHPTRFAGLATFAPQDPGRAVKEMERAINALKLNGFVINSHTNNEYLDLPKYWPILEAAEALNAAIYIHPRAPSDGMAAPFRDYNIESAVWGYGMETGTHAVRLMLSGVFDRFPKLRIVLGHMGEAIPFWLWRMDYMGAPTPSGTRSWRRRPNKRKPSEYFQQNFAITTSGVEDPLALRYCIDKIGVDNIMWAIDYPYQPTTPAVAFIDSAPLSDAERAKIAHGNAERIFHIGGRKAT